MTFVTSDRDQCGSETRRARLVVYCPDLAAVVNVVTVSQLAVLLKLQGVQFYPVRKASWQRLHPLELHWNHRYQQCVLTEPVSVIVATSLDLILHKVSCHLFQFIY